MNNIGGQGADLQASQRDLQKRVDEIVDRFSNASLSLQKQGVECSLACFTPDANYKDVGNCIQKCQKPFTEIGNITNGEFQQLQNSIQGCQQSCIRQFEPRIEAIRAGLVSGEVEKEKGAIQISMEQCAQKCIADAGPTIEGVESRLMGYLKAALK